VRSSHLVVSLALMGASGIALASHCPQDMKAIDEKLATKPTLSGDEAAKVKKLRADGEALHKAGKHTESEKALGDARKILGI
jgi:hypothetical protein